MDAPTPPDGQAQQPHAQTSAADPAPADAAPPPPRSRMAVASLVTGLLGLFPAALALGLVALSRLSDTDAARPARRGRGLAVAGVALAGAQIVALAVAVPVWVINAGDDARGAEVAHDDRGGPAGEEPAQGDGEGAQPTDPAEPGRPDEPRPAVGETIDVYELRVGDCFDSGTGLERFDEEEATEESTVTLRDCDRPHEAEAYGTTRVTGHEDFPGDEELTQLAFDECGRLVQPYVLDTWTLAADVTFYFYYPQQTSWAAGDREILCFFGHQDGSPLDGSLRGDPDGLSAEQARYLEVTAPLEVTIWHEPASDAPLAEWRAWAEEMAETVAEEARTLDEERWSSTVADLVSDLAAARRDSAEHWDRAAGAKDRAAFERQYDEGYATLGVETEISIRDRLGLATQPQ